MAEHGDVRRLSGPATAGGWSWGMWDWDGGASRRDRVARVANERPPRRHHRHPRQPSKDRGPIAARPQAAAVGAILRARGFRVRAGPRRPDTNRSDKMRVRNRADAGRSTGPIPCLEIRLRGVRGDPPDGQLLGIPRRRVFGTPHLPTHQVAVCGCALPRDNLPASRDAIRVRLAIDDLNDSESSSRRGRARRGQVSGAASKRTDVV